MNWVNFWTFFFFLSLAVFTCLAVVVSIGGFFNIKSLFKDLSDAKEKAEQDALSSAENV